MSPRSTSGYSTYEGQIYLSTKYPSHPGISRDDFEEMLIAILAVDGTMCAWKKLISAEAGDLEMLLEFHDAPMVARAVDRCNRMTLGVCIGRINSYLNHVLIHHRVTLSSMSHHIRRTFPFVW